MKDLFRININEGISSDVERHQGRLIFLEYTGEGEIDSTALLVGKGITYDTGGLDIKSTFNLTSF